MCMSSFRCSDGNGDNAEVFRQLRRTGMQLPFNKEAIRSSVHTMLDIVTCRLAVTNLYCFNRLLIFVILQREVWEFRSTAASVLRRFKKMIYSSSSVAVMFSFLKLQRLNEEDKKP